MFSERGLSVHQGSDLLSLLQCPVSATEGSQPARPRCVGHCLCPGGRMVGRRTSAQPTAACEKAEATGSENKVDAEGLTSVVQTLRSQHRAGRHADGPRVGLREARQAGEGQGRITKHSSNLLRSPPASPEVPIHPQRPKAEKLTRSAPVTQGRRHGLSSKKANVYLSALFRHPAPR